MEPDVIPAALADHLGPDATDGLRQLLGRVRSDVREDAVSACTERFERRLVEEISGVRLQIAQVESSIRQDMTRLRADLGAEIVAVRNDLGEKITALRAELRDDMGLLRSQAEAGRFELLKWAFIFWIGQVAVIGTIVGVIVRLAA